MIIKYEKGDLVTMIQNSLSGKHSSIQLAHGCNCCRTMGGGIAGALRKFPEIYEADVNFPYPELGKMSVANIITPESFPEHSALVFNLYTQQYASTTSRQLNYSAVAQCFIELNQDAMPHDALYIPHIGAGLGGGNWQIIEAVINDATPELDIIVIDYVPNVDPRDSYEKD